MSCEDFSFKNMVNIKPFTFVSILLQRAVDRGWFRKVRSVTEGGPDMAAVLSTAAEIAGALRYLHEQNILHGDLSNGNVLLCTNKDDPRGFVSKVCLFCMF